MTKNNYNYRLLTVVMVLFAITALLYLPTINHEFVFDDRGYILENSNVRDGLTSDNLKWAFASFHMGNWHPLTWMSHTLDIQLFGLDAGKHHLVNLLLHLVNTVVLFFVLEGMTKAFLPSVLVAALFALHPLHVESVAWISERKDLLSTLFWFLSLGAYLWYTRSPSFKRYMVVFLLFVLGLMAKSMLVTLPFLLLVLDYWPLGRLQKASSFLPLLREKLPLLSASAAVSVATVVAQRYVGALGRVEVYTFKMRVMNSLVSYVKYIFKMLWPSDLAVFYPYQGESIFWGYVVFSAVFLMGVTGIIFLASRRFPYLLVGWFWYLGTMVPVIGLVHVGSQSMADRYTYVPLIGLFIIVAWGLRDLAGEITWRKAIVVGLALVVVISSAVATRFQVRHWKDEETLFRHAIEVVPNNWLALNNLGLALKEQKRYKEALPYFLEAVRIYPRYYEARVNLALLYSILGNKREAIIESERAIQIDPINPKAYVNLGLIYVSLKDKAKALTIYNRLLAVDPVEAERLARYISYLR